jgi:hypothetical protein
MGKWPLAPVVRRLRSLTATMNWKRCDGCTRAIASATSTCEYCGHACEDALDELKPDESDQPGFAWPPEEFASDRALDSAPHALAHLELNQSFPFPSERVEPLPLRESSRTLDSLPIDDEAPYAPILSAPSPAEDAADPMPEPAPVEPPRQTGAGRRRLVMVGAALFATPALIFTILSMRGSASPTAAETAVPPAAHRPAAARPAVPSARTSPAPAATAVAPRWNRMTEGRWVGDSRNSVAFELQALNKIQVWTRSVTPVLVVRCKDGRLESFVFTQSAARMEAQDGDHTVRVGFDDGAELTERWPDSEDHDALFARDGAAFTRRLAASHTLRFGFEPHNSGPATARFAVDGITELLAASAGPCGWKN